MQDFPVLCKLIAISVLHPLIETPIRVVLSDLRLDPLLVLGLD